MDDWLTNMQPYDVNYSTVCTYSMIRDVLLLSYTHHSITLFHYWYIGMDSVSLSLSMIIVIVSVNMNMNMNMNVNMSCC